MTIIFLLAIIIVISPKLFLKDSNVTTPTKEIKPSPSSAEKLSCQALRDITQQEVLENHRPDFLKNPKTKRNLELDCYCYQEKIGVEYNGDQHYQYPNHFHKSYKDFEEQVERDNTKRELCKKNGVHLIEIPHTIVTGKNKVEKYSALKDHITKNLFEISYTV